MERALDTLLDVRSAGFDWLEAAASLLTRAPRRAQDPLIEAPRCRVLVVFGVGGPEVRRSG
jgi:hypothetical protein